MLRVSQLALLLACVAPGALAADYFGAIAYSTSTGAHGWAKDHPSQAAAQKAARAACGKHAKDCKPVLWFKNGCGALATGPRSGAGWDWAADQTLADRRAISACSQQSSACTVKQRVCTSK